ncbi:armadillo repeat-containing kinesin-like protein 2 [Pyrus ussuriensis x Pyrus communis]|uniref:Kinesin-like protein n=1 Tax=Pyrus ussuriensis x Pyrus communis TaxID=2448454 RepID=A0A5N5I3W7_9ROSA|nr:armadillo repeat-containing kinesin-like protein 2 [Pyrus ussuriensis x Pyrus communis]
MASRNYVVQRGAVKLDRPVNFRTSSFKSRLPPSQSPGSALHRSSPALFGSAASKDDGVPGRVRVAVRLRPRNAQEMMADADFADSVELQPELKRLKLRKNNWELDTYEFDDMLTEYVSQKRVYEVVAKPVSVLDGYNGMVMAYGQTGTGKTFTLGQVGEGDTSDRGIRVRSMEGVLADISPETDSISVSYLQVVRPLSHYWFDLLNAFYPRTGDVIVPGATIVEIKSQQSFLELLRCGEAHRVAANTKLNTESSRSHAILMVCLWKRICVASENGDPTHLTKPFKPLVRKSKLVVVDLAGSERIQKSGCINSLAENRTHVPFRDSKLTRLLKDSFGGETTSTILFGQRAMKVENILKIKEEFDYKSLSRKLEVQVDKLIAENERQHKAFEDEVERINLEAQKRVFDVERNFADALEKERRKCQMDYMEAVKELEEKLVSIQKPDHMGLGLVDIKCNREGSGFSPSNEVAELQELLQNEIDLREKVEEDLKNLKSLGLYSQSEADGDTEFLKLHKLLEEEAQHKKKLEEELVILRSQLLQSDFEAEQTRSCLDRGRSGNGFTGLDSSAPSVRHSYPRDTGNGQKEPASLILFLSINAAVGLQKILSLLESDDANVCIHAVKVVANLAAEAEANQKRIVQAGGLTSLLMLLRSFEDETVQRVAAFAIANLAMNEANQEIILEQGGISLLATTAADADDAQTLRMIAGAIANLCGNDKLQMKLRFEGGIKALLGIVRCGHPDVLSQVVRGIANFAKCESRACTQGIRNGRSFLIEDGALPWIVQNANDEAAPIRRHIELALYHLAQHEVNAKDMISGGALWELDIRSLAHRTLNSSPTFRAEIRRLRIDY